MKQSSLEPIYVFVSPPSLEALESRLRGRGTEKEEDIVRRLGNAAKELEYGHGEGNFDLVLVNDDLEKSLQELVTNIKKWYPHLEEKKKEE